MGWSKFARKQPECDRYPSDKLSAHPSAHVGTPQKRKQLLFVLLGSDAVTVTCTTNASVNTGIVRTCLVRDPSSPLRYTRQTRLLLACSALEVASSWHGRARSPQPTTSPGYITACDDPRICRVALSIWNVDGQSHWTRRARFAKASGVRPELSWAPQLARRGIGTSGTGRCSREAGMFDYSESRISTGMPCGAQQRRPRAWLQGGLAWVQRRCMSLHQLGGRNRWQPF